MQDWCLQTVMTDQHSTTCNKTSSCIQLRSLLAKQKWYFRTTWLLGILSLGAYLYYTNVSVYRTKNNEVIFDTRSPTKTEASINRKSSKSSETGLGKQSPKTNVTSIGEKSAKSNVTRTGKMSPKSNVTNIGKPSLVLVPPTCRRLIRDDNEDRRRACRNLINGGKFKAPWYQAGFNIDYVGCVAKLSNCSNFRSVLGYTDYVTPAEREFPLAFSVLTYENLEQTERLLRLIYRPHNVYCLHVDAKSPPAMHSAAQVVASCLPNVFVARPPVKVAWGNISIVEAELSCIRLLLKSNPSWKYFINLVGRDFPLRTNRELVEILKAYGGANDVAGTLKGRHLEWFQYSWTDGLQGERKTSPPHGFVITKGSTHMAITRAFAEFALNDRKATDLLNWMRDIRIPDEHFFQTLNHNPQLNIPGSFKGNPDKKQSLTRMKLWKGSIRNYRCSGSFIRSICDISEGDLPWVTAAPQMFVNKIRMDWHPTAFHCLEQWFVDRLQLETLEAMNNASSKTSSKYSPPFDVNFYAKQPFVLRHV